MTALFDMRLRAMRRDRAAHMGVETFLLERAFEDCLERIELTGIVPDRTLLLGCPDPGWASRVASLGGAVEVADPGPSFALAAGGDRVVEDRWPLQPEGYDLVIAIGTLDTIDDLPGALRTLSNALRPSGLLIGAMSGGDTLPLTRRVMAAADRQSGAATPHVHPRVEASSLAPLLQAAGLGAPVVDIDRVAVRYGSLAQLVRDLRAMAATNILTARTKVGLGKAALAAAQAEFANACDDDRATETFEILHFAGWKPAR